MSLMLSTAALADQRSAETHKSAGVAYFKAGTFDLAIREFEAAYRLEPAPNLLFNLGRANEELGRKEQAIEYFEKFLAGDGSEDRGDEARARVVALQRALADQAEKIRIAQEEAAAQDQEVAQAAALKEQAVALDAEAQAQEQAGRPKEAIATWRQAHALLSDPVYLVKIGEAARKMGDLTKAIASYEGYLAEVPKGASSVEARIAVSEMRQTLAVELASRGVPAADPPAKWLDGRSRWGLGIKAGTVLVSPAPDLKNSNGLCGQSNPDNGVASGSGEPGYSFEGLVSLAATRWLSLDIGIAFTEQRIVGECLDLSSAATVKLTMLEIPLKAKLTLLEPSSGFVANTYVGAWGAPVQRAKLESEVLAEDPENGEIKGLGIGATAGLEAGMRAAAGEIFLDLRYQGGSPRPQIEFVDPVASIDFRQIHVFKILLGYVYRGQ